MKKLIVISAIAALLSGLAVANPSTLEVGGFVPVTCNLETGGPDFHAEFTTEEMTGVISPAVRNIPISITCNDPEGATVTLKSAKGWLGNVDDDTKGVNYSATLKDTPFTNVTLFATGGGGPKDASEIWAGGPTLAGGVNGEIEVQLTSTTVLSGNHSDNLEVGVVAN